MEHVHVVVQGECLSSIAKCFGFGKWRTIYYHPKNADLRKKRPNPNLILPGDRIFIPDPNLREEVCPTDQRHRFQVKVDKALLRLRLTDRRWHPLTFERYRLAIKDAVYEDAAGGNGVLEREIPVDAEEAELTVWFADGAPFKTFSWTLKLGHLDPVSELSGVKARLTNLGLPCVAVETQSGSEVPQTMSEKLRDFQRRTDITPNGELGAETRERLENQHDRLTE